MARIPDEEIERLKSEISLERLAEAKGVKLKKHGEDLIGPLPVPRRPGAEPGDHAGEEPLALPGGVPGGRDGDRLGDAGGAGELSARGGALAGADLPSLAAEERARRRQRRRKLAPVLEAERERRRSCSSRW